MADFIVGNVSLVSGPTGQGVAAEAIGPGQSIRAVGTQVFLSAASLTIADADCSGIAIQGALIGERVVYAKAGAIINITGPHQIGFVVMVSAISGGLAPENDLSIGNHVTVVGVTTSIANILVNPIVSKVLRI